MPSVWPTPICYPWATWPNSSTLTPSSATPTARHGRVTARNQGSKSMNKFFRIVWSAIRGAFIVAHEKANSHGKPSSTRRGAATALMASLLTSSGLIFAAPPVNTLPTGGQIVGGAAAGNIATSGNAMTVTQNQQRMVANWDTYSIGQNASVHYQQPTGGVALNRVNGGQPSEIFGQLSATGTVYLLNSAGILFGRTAQVDVGALVAATGKMSDADFLAGKMKIVQDGATGKIVNEGQLKAAIDGYIALLAPEVRNQGVIFAEKGTIALAAGEAYELQFDGTRLANVRVEPGVFNALVENHQAVEAPGGLIILSAKAVNRLQGAAIRNIGTLDASSMTMKGGRILLEASSSVENSGTIKATGSASQPGGSVEIIAPQVLNSGMIDVSGSTAGSVTVKASDSFTQSGTILAKGLVDRGGEVRLALAQTVTLNPGSSIDVSGSTQGGSVYAESASTVDVTGTIDASSDNGAGGSIEIAAGSEARLNNATLDASGPVLGGTIRVSARQSTHASLADPQNPINDPTAPGTPGHVLITGNTTVATRSSRGKGGRVELTGDDLLLGTGSLLDASGATGGGEVLVGGDWQGSNGVYQATTVTMEQGAAIDVSATENGNGGKVVLWSDVSNADSHTAVAGIIKSEGAGNGNGGKVETSGHELRVQRTARVSTLSLFGKNGEWLIDPTNFTISAGGAAQTTSGMGADTLATNLASGNVTITTSASGSENGDITVAADITKSAGADATLTLKAHGSVIQNAGTNITSTSNKLNLVLWADMDATGGGFVQLGGASATTIDTNGGHLWTGGGSGSTTWNGLTVGNGYAIGNSTANSNGIYLDNVTIATGGGNIAMYGQSTSGAAVQVGGASGDTTADGIHFSSLHGSSINSGAGIILLSGKGASTTAGTRSGGVGFANASTPVTHTVTSAATSGNAITITGDASAASAAQVPGVWLDGVNISASAASGSVVVTGVNGTGTDTANSKAIQQGNFANSAISAAGGDITVIGNSLALTDNGSTRKTTLTGTSTSTITLQPYTANTTVGLNDDTRAFNITSDLISNNLTPGFKGLTVGSTTSGGLSVGNQFSWSNYLLKLISGSSIAINNTLTGTGTAGLELDYGGSYSLGNNKVNLASTGSFATKYGSAPVKNYVVITSLGADGSTTGTDLQGMAGSTSSNYVLGADIDASPTSGWTNKWTPVQNFSGEFDGLGHSITGLTIDGTGSNRGLFGSSTAGATFRNVGLINASLTGNGTYAGALIGSGGGTNLIISNVYATGSVSGDRYVGGLIGGSAATNLTISNSYTDVVVTASHFDSRAGGIVGIANYVAFTDVHANGSVSSVGDYLGGLVGYANTGGSFTRTYNLGQVGVKDASTAYASATSGTDYAAGLVGFANGNVWIDNSYNKGDIYGYWGIGGLVGYAGPALNINKSYNTGRVSTMQGNGYKAGGLVGVSGSSSLTIRDSYVLGDVYAYSFAGGLVGELGTGGGTLVKTYVGSSSVYAPTTANYGFGDLGTYSATAGKEQGGWSFEGLVYNSAIGQPSSRMDSGNFFNSTQNSWNVAPVSLASMTGQNTYYFTNVFVNANARFDFTNTWATTAGTNGGFPYLISNPPVIPLTINVTALSKTYGDANPSLTGQYSLSGCTGCITLDWGSLLTTSTAAGSYAYSTNNLLSLTYNSGNASSYSISWGGTSFTVNPRPINITVNSGQTKTYGAVNPTYSYTAEAAGSSRGLVNGDTFTGALGRVAGENVGTYAINNVGTLANSNYAIAVVPANFSITQAPLTVTASAQSKTYGSALTLGTSAFTSSGLQNSETIGGVTLTASGGTAAIDNAGSYSITPSAATGGTFTASNYNITYNTGVLTVDPALITLTATAQSKTYGSTLNLGTTAYSITSGSLKNSDTITGVTLTSAGAVDTANATTYTITPSAATGTGGFGTTNYTISYVDGTLTVNKAPLTITAANDSKTYDAIAYSGGNGVSYSGFVLGQDITALGGTLVYTTGTSNGATNAGSYTIRPSGYTSGNYSFSYVDGTLTIDRKTVTLSAAKTYDGDTTLGAGTVTIGTGIGGQSLTYSGATAFSKNVADNTTNYISALTLGNGTGLASNYQLPTLDAANAPVTISKKDVSVTSIIIADKVYDGTTNATSVQSTVLSGVIGADSANVNTTGTLASFSGKDVGTYSISVTGMSLTGSAAGNYNLTSSTATDSSVAITPKTVTLSAAKTYDGTTSLTGYLTLGGFIGSETLNYSGATANNSHVATAGKYVSAITLTNGNNGGLASNYQLPTLNAANAPVTINAATLTSTLTNSGVTKVYDGSTASSLTPTWSFSGLVAGDTAATLAYTGRNYNSKDVLTANTVTVSGLSISAITGANSSAASDYVLDATSKTVAGTITPKTVTVSGLAASGKIYDATTDVTITNWGSVTTGVGSETLVLNHGTASFSDKNKANGKTVTAIGYALADGGNGGLASNYQLSSTSATTTANITAKPITLAGSASVDKTYDGRTAMPVGNIGYGSLVGVVSGDTVNITGAPVYDSANAGSRTVLVGTVGIAGTDAGNYSLTWTNGSGTIAKAPLTISANADAKFVTYADGAGYNGVSYSGFVNGETISALNIAGLTVTRSNSGQNNAGSYGGVLVPSGATAANYQITYSAGDYTIVPAGQLLVRVSNASTTYGTAATYSIIDARYMDGGNVIHTLAAPSQSGNTFTYSDGAGGSAVFTLGPVTPQTSTAGQLKAGVYGIDASNIAETSTNFSNSLTVVGGLTVTPKALTANATNVTKVYDSTTAMTNVVLGYTGLESGDLVTIAGNGNFGDKNVGTGKSYSVTSLTLGSSDAANYYLFGGDSFNGSNGEITPKTVSLAASRTYDGTRNLDASALAITTGVGSETLSFSGATAHSKNVGTGNYVDAITLLDGINGGLASNYQLPSLTTPNSDNGVSIARKTLTLSGLSAADKIYDGTTNATLAVGSLLGLVGSETLTLNSVGNFSGPNVGIGKTVLAQLTLADGTGLAGNYTISDATTTATINPVPNVVPPLPPSVPPTPPAPPSVPDPTPPVTPDGGSSSGGSGSGSGGSGGSGSGSGSSSGGDTSSGSGSGSSSSGGSGSGSGSSSGGDTSGGSGSGSSSSGGSSSGSGSSSGGDTSSGSGSGSSSSGGSSSSSGSSSGGDTSSGSGSGSSSSGGSSSGSG
ncbi:MAG: hypothetical protein CVU16_09090 [Betaproteobacteria bacterium HGW-Betaproteobacteria-10]|nr:MAG: hypothetical protein CVU16_09090 [Betaproteobacteria bacterium HGW-Betaproteobacteria-10]